MFELEKSMVVIASELDVLRTPSTWHQTWAP